jgi:uncharacterized protein YjbI with pentapeptide repeats
LPLGPDRSTPTNLGAAKLRYVVAKAADLTGAILDGVDLSGADVTGARMKGASLRDADLETTIGFEDAYRLA